MRNKHLLLTIIATAISLNACATAPSTTPPPEATTLTNESSIAKTDESETAASSEAIEPSTITESSDSALPTDYAVIKDIELSADDITTIDLEEGILNINLATEIEFQDGQSEGNLEFINVVENIYDTTVVLKRDDNDDILFRSGTVKAGQSLTNFNLNQPLEKGDYECTAIVTTMTADGELVGQVDVKIMLKILN